MEACLDTNSPDGRFIIDRAPADDSGRVLVARGFSGHGFKFAPVIGEAPADPARDGRTSLPIAVLFTARLRGPA